METNTKQAYLTLRAVCVFLVFLVIGAGIWFFSLHYHADVAQWTSVASRESFVHEETVYFLSGEVGTTSIPEKSYQAEKLLGEVKPAKLFDFSKPFRVWSVKDKEGYLIMEDGSGKQYLYYAEGKKNPAETQTDTARVYDFSTTKL